MREMLQKIQEAIVIMSMLLNMVWTAALGALVAQLLYDRMRASRRRRELRLAVRRELLDWILNTPAPADFGGKQQSVWWSPIGLVSLEQLLDDLRLGDPEDGLLRFVWELVHEIRFYNHKANSVPLQWTSTWPLSDPTPFQEMLWGNMSCHFAEVKLKAIEAFQAIERSPAVGERLTWPSLSEKDRGQLTRIRDNMKVLKTMYSHTSI
jgi:hypothetical protein